MIFEAVVTLCMSAADDPCRDQLVPGFEAPSLAACEAALTVDDARCQPAGEALTMTQIAPGVFVHEGLIEEPNAANRGDVSNLGFVIGAQSVAVIDTGAARWVGEALWRAIRAQTDLPVSHVILTHMHPDHVLGAQVFAEAGAQIVGHARLPRALADRQANYIESLTRLIGPAFIGTQPPAIDEMAQGVQTLDLGNRVLELRAWPPAHTGADVTVLDRETATLFAGDLLFHRHTPALDGRLRGWLQVLEDIVAIPARQVVPGHGDPVLPWPDAVAGMTRYLGVLERDTRAAIDAGERLGQAVDHIAASEAPHWDLFDAYNPRNATVAFTELEWD